jgi:YVTN family beta-propeller protein
VSLLTIGIVFACQTSLLAAQERQTDYLGPTALAVTEDGETALVACADAGQVLWIDVTAAQVVRRVAVPGRPSDIAITPDGSQLLVACASPRSTVRVMDIDTGHTRQEIAAGHTAQAIAVSPDGSRLYVCNRFDHDVRVIDLATGRERRRVAVAREPIAVAVSPDGSSVIVANHLPNMPTDITLVGDVSPVVTIIDAHSPRTRQIHLPSGSNGLREVCVTPDGQHALVTHLLSNFQMVPTRLNTGWINTNVISIIEIESGHVYATIGMDEMDRGVGNPWGVTCTADGRTVCVSHAGTHEVSHIPLSVLLSSEARGTMSPMMAAWPIYTNLGATLWNRVSLAGRGPRGLATAGQRLYVAEYFSDAISVIDFHDAEKPELRRIPLGPAPRLTIQRRGELLFHDATICYQHWQSCASCHPDGRVDALNWDLLNDGAGNPKNTKSMLLTHRTPPVMAEGVRATAELAVRSGIEHILFSTRPEEEAEAIDEYLKALKPVPSPHLVESRLSESAERGRELFHSAAIRCDRCHPAPLYTDRRKHNVGSRGMFDKTSRFDTPTLVEVWRTAPYLHDGRYVTVKELLVDGKHGLKDDVELTEQEIEDLLEFVLSL